MFFTLEILACIQPSTFLFCICEIISYRFSSELEISNYHQKTADFVYLYFVMISMLNVIGLIQGMLWTNECLLTSILYIWSRQSTKQHVHGINKIISFWGNSYSSSFCLLVFRWALVIIRVINHL